MDIDLPALPLDSWRPTKDTLHLWTQVVGKVKLASMPPRNHWWNVTLRPSARGLATGRLPGDTGNLELELDLVGHRLRARTTTAEDGFPLADGLSVAAFYTQLLELLARLDVRVDLIGRPFGLPVEVPFEEDEEHRSYDGAAVSRYLTALQWSADVLEQFAGWYSGKSSPVHLFWHSFDLAHGRFSGRRADDAPGSDPVTAEAYSHEVISFGFWAGDDRTPYPAYYSYTAPEPASLAEQELRPSAAAWSTQPGGSLAILPYEDVRAARDPAQDLLDFFQSAFEAGAALAGWDLADTATAWGPRP